MIPETVLKFSLCVFILSPVLSCSGRRICGADTDAVSDSLAVMPQDDTLSVFVIGDVMAHTPQFRHDHRLFFKHIAPEMRSADLAVANMEFTLGGEPHSGYPRFSAPDYMASYMAGDCGVDVFLTANNHIIDRGAAGLERTLGIYSAMRDSVLFTGSAASKEEKLRNYPLILERKGIRLALINFTYGTNGLFVKGWPNTNYMEEDDVRAAFARARADSADFIIVLPHWGEEYQLRHNNFQQQWARMLVEEGACAVVGSHPHVVQDTCHIDGVPVIYSLGNAVSNMTVQNSRLGLAVILRFVREASSGRCSMLRPELRFLWCTRPGELEEAHSTIFADSSYTSIPSYPEMISTLRRVRKVCGIGDDKHSI